MTWQLSSKHYIRLFTLMLNIYHWASVGIFYNALWWHTIPLCLSELKYRWHCQIYKMFLLSDSNMKELCLLYKYVAKYKVVLVYLSNRFFFKKNVSWKRVSHAKVIVLVFEHVYFNFFIIIGQVWFCTFCIHVSMVIWCWEISNFH